jgi:hypothetical protein
MNTDITFLLDTISEQDKRFESLLTRFVDRLSNIPSVAPSSRPQPPILAEEQKQELIPEPVNQTNHLNLVPRSIPFEL